MEFLPFSEAKRAEKEQIVAVDCFLPGALNLSHWRGAGPPPLAVDDTSAAIVLNALERDLIPRMAKYVTNNHFDVDGFIGIWSMMNPELAQKNVQLLKAVAVLGDFRELPANTDLANDAIRLVSWLNTVEKARFYAPFGEKHHEEKASVAKYKFFLAAFEEVLNNSHKFSHEWDEEAEKIACDLSTLKTQGKIRLHEDIRLLVVMAPRPLHYYALFGQSAQADMVLSIYPDQKYELEYKYTTWVDAYGRRSLPRLSFTPLVQHLNQLETSGDQWTGTDVTDTGPVLRLGPSIMDKEIRFDHPYNRTFYSSSITPTLLEKAITGFYRNSYAGINPKEIWTWEEIRRFNQQL